MIGRVMSTSFMCFTLVLLIVLLSTVSASAFASSLLRHGGGTSRRTRARRLLHDASPLSMLFLFGGGGVKIPGSTQERDRQAIDAVKAAVSKPKTPGFCLIECEFPPLAALNKLGDGSLQSANQVDDANLAFGVQLARSLSVVPFAPTVTLLASTAASQRLVQKAQKTYPLVHPLQQGLPSPINKSSVLVLVAPSSTRDYSLAQEMVQEYGATVILVNGLAKTPKSVSGQATMAYYLKPLTYNSQVAGYLVRRYPQAWTTLSSFALSSGRKRTTTVLQTATDADILVPGTNTPDLRAAVRAVQQYVDQQAMAARRGFS